MPKEPLELKPANDPKQIAAIVKKTIQSIYPKYYPAGAVRFFLDLHCEERIKFAMEEEEIYLVLTGDWLLGTAIFAGIYQMPATKTHLSKFQ